MLEVSNNEKDNDNNIKIDISGIELKLELGDMSDSISESAIRLLKSESPKYISDNNSNGSDSSSSDKSFSDDEGNNEVNNEKIMSKEVLL